jgi:hypothetical protein
MDRYVVISADGHAGRRHRCTGYLDPGCDRFDEHQRMMTELRAAMGNNDSTFREEWEAETDGDGGLTAAFDSGAQRILDTEGVIASVVPRRDVLGTGRMRRLRSGPPAAADKRRRRSPGVARTPVAGRLRRARIPIAASVSR